mmetsp:Transcript_21208/g.52169  ORF Transcript_21208/g.52169 Transcript_21208/m.52169 type:complete len:348 (-) Transcript_21208:2440-3483(-)
MSAAAVHLVVVFAALVQVSDAFSLHASAPGLVASSSRSFISRPLSFAKKASSQRPLRNVALGASFGASMMAEAVKADCACTIIGAGRIGTALADMGKAAGFTDTVVKRGEKIPEDGAGPIYVTTRNDDLKAVIDMCPPSRKGDLVFYGQNGYIEDFLKKESVYDSTSQVLVYMAVAKLGEKPTDGITDKNPEGLTSVTGKWADQVSARLQGAGLTCHAMDRDKFRARMFEKHMWICAFMLIGVHNGGITVGDVESKHKDDLVQMVTEMMAAISESTGTKFEDGVPERLLAYARSVAHFPTALKEFEWRNKFFLDLTRAREAKGEADLTPLHTSMLMKAKETGAVKFD